VWITLPGSKISAPITIPGAGAVYYQYRVRGPVHADQKTPPFYRGAHQQIYKIRGETRRAFEGQALPTMDRDRQWSFFGVSSLAPWRPPSRVSMGQRLGVFECASRLIDGARAAATRRERRISWIENQKWWCGSRRSAAGGGAQESGRWGGRIDLSWPRPDPRPLIPPRDDHPRP